MLHRIVSTIALRPYIYSYVRISDVCCRDMEAVTIGISHDLVMSMAWFAWVSSSAEDRSCSSLVLRPTKPISHLHVNYNATKKREHS